MRKPMAFPVRFVAEGQTVQTTTRDLDEESVFIRCVEPPAVGERVTLRLYLPGIAEGETIAAEVHQRTGDGFRACFVSLPPDARERIDAALSSPAPPMDGPPATAAAGENRRYLPRFLVRFRAAVGNGDVRAQRQGLNLSASGVFVETDSPPEVDDIVQVILDFADGKPPAEVQASVVHRVPPGSSTPAGAGVQFIGANDAFRARLDAYLEKLRDR